MDLLKHFPYPIPREIQKQFLKVLEESWDKFDCFVVSAPTAWGKTAIAQTLMNALHSVSTITPTNLLVDQFLNDFPDTPTLRRMDSYYCEEWDRPCPKTRSKLQGFCKGCPCSFDLARAKYKKGPGIYNYHTYLAHKLYRDVLIVDEAHNLLPVIRERMGLTLWQHDYKYPSGMYSAEQMKTWLHSLPDRVRAHKKIQALRSAVDSNAPEYMPQRGKDLFNGKGTIRGEPEERDCLKLLPVDISTAPPLFWPREVQKVVLLSATISKKDIEQLGLSGGRKRVCYIDCKSPIPRGNRPIILDNLIAVNRNNMEQAGPLLANYIEELAEFHKGEKGVIHATYQMASILAQHLQSGRYLFHTRENKKQQYQLFRDSDPAAGRILIACGMYEGIDLPEDLGRWQVISKIPWQSLGSPAIKYLAEKDPELYVWETVKTVIQACGRICRTPTDYGVTYIPDSTFDRMYREGISLIPQWFQDGLVNPP